MLILSRKQSERIKIGEGPDAIWLTVVEIQRGKVRIGVDAPKGVLVLREELVEADDASNVNASR